MVTCPQAPSPPRRAGSLPALVSLLRWWLLAGWAAGCGGCGSGPHRRGVLVGLGGGVVDLGSGWPALTWGACDAAPTRADELDGLLGLGGGRRGGGWRLGGCGLGGRAYVAEQDRGPHGDGDRDHGAERGGQLQPLGERRAGRAEQGRAEPLGQLRGDADGAAEGVPRGRGGLARDAGGQGGGQRAAVDGHADAAKDGDAERAAQLRAGLGDPRGGAGALGWGRAD